MLVSEDHHDKTTQIEWLEQQKSVDLQSWRLRSLRSGCHTDLVLASTLYLACSWLLLLVLTWRWGPAGGGGWEMEKQVYKGTNPVMRAPPS